jgi:ADP-ribosylation factor GTPase-activating protein 2/3
MSRSTNLDSWTSDQLKIMSYGGNARALTFFKQHGWTEGGKIEAKYTSRAAELYRQLLAKEVSQSGANGSIHFPTNLHCTLSTTHNSISSDDFIDQIQTENQDKVKPEPDIVPVQVACHPTSTTIRRPISIGAKKVTSGKAGSLGVKKLTSKVSTL